jgi:metal-responsive CopG/Arc/MetJ family transcriptional regulator
MQRKPATPMTVKRKEKIDVSKRMKRISVGFPPELFTTLEQIADRQKVSVGWIIRDAAEKYVNDRWPLLAHKG